MPDFLYPTQADSETYEWLKEMLNGWEASQKPYLCFPFGGKAPKYLMDNTSQSSSFWLYMYYRKAFAFPGQIKYRIHVVGWRPGYFQLPTDTGLKFNTSNTIFQTFQPHLQSEIYFLCDAFEEIRHPNNSIVTIDDGFTHPEGSSLPHLMRNKYVGIPPMRYQGEFKVIRHYGAT